MGSCYGVCCCCRVCACAYVCVWGGVAHRGPLLQPFFVFTIVLSAPPRTPLPQVPPALFQTGGEA